MPNDDKGLLAQVRRLQKAVTRKVSRIHTHHGVEMSGSSADPRISAGARNQLNDHQLREHAHALADFLRRDVQFVPDSQRRPMPRSEWLQYKRLEKQWNTKVNAYFDNLKNIVLPGGLTIAQAQAAFRPDRPELTNPSVNSPSPINRESRNLASKKGLLDAIATMTKRNQSDYFAEQLEGHKETMDKLLDIIGDDRLAEIVHSLSDKQFDILWNWTPFITAAGYLYEVAQRRLEASERREFPTVERDFIRSAYEHAEWAQTLEI